MKYQKIPEVHIAILLSSVICNSIRFKVLYVYGRFFVLFCFATCVLAAGRGQKRVSDALEVGLRVISRRLVLGLVSSDTVNHQAISSAPAT